MLRGQSSQCHGLSDIAVSRTLMHQQDLFSQRDRSPPCHSRCCTIITASTDEVRFVREACVRASCGQHPPSREDLGLGPDVPVGLDDLADDGHARVLLGDISVLRPESRLEVDAEL